MPIYEYECSHCGALFEELRQMAGRNAPASCKKCGSASRPILSVFCSPNKNRAANKSELARTNDKSRDPNSDGLSFRNCTFSGLGVGVSVPAGTKLHMEETRFKNVRTPVLIRDQDDQSQG